MMKNAKLPLFVAARKGFLTIVAALTICACLTGCDREAPTVGGIDDVIELDCRTEFNLKDYLIENVAITDETDDGAVEYDLSDLEYAIECDGDAYNADTGEFNTDKFGEYDAELTVKDESNNKTTYAFTVKLDPLHINSSVEETVEMDCGTLFNVNDYFAENVVITNAAESAEYELGDFDYTIECDETVYNAASGKLDTGKFGEYTATLTINSESFETNNTSFAIKLNPLSIEKGYYVYEDETVSSGYSYLGFCEYKNTSEEDLSVASIEFQYFDKDGVMIGSTDMSDYSRDYVASGESGYALDTFSTYDSSISSADEITEVKVNVDYEKPSGTDDTSLETEGAEITNGYEYNVSGFAGTTVITNPYDKNVEYYTLLMGMYDAGGKLVGVMESMDTDGIDAQSKARSTAAWLPDSRAIPDTVASLKASAKVTMLEGE